MGIRFYCPNGHRLHVKSFLAGKRGICPHCSARFHIPPESEIPRGSPKTRLGLSAEQNAAEDLEPTGFSAAAIALDAPSEPLSQSKVTQGVESTGDPIAEAPDAVWYVRPPAGGQYGPAKGDVMRKWIEEGRVSPDSMVWREGWLDWSSAGLVFRAVTTTYTAATAAAVNGASIQSLPSRELPSRDLLGSHTPRNSRADLGGFTDHGPSDNGLAASQPVQPPVTLSANGRRSTRAPARRKSLAAVIVLGLVVLLLVVVLVLVISTRS